MTACLVPRAGALERALTVPPLKLRPDESRAGLHPAIVSAAGPC